MSDWNQLVYVLFDLLQGPLASIEILPGGLEEWETIEVPPEAEKPSPRFPIVFVEGNLGIPKKILYAVYLAAVHMPWRTSDVRTANAASSIIILSNPAHQTALNVRKRLIRDGQLDAANELLLTELVARGSPEFGKQSMIWAHRRWCFGRIYGVMGSAAAVNTPHLQYWASSEEMQTFPRMTPAAVQHELDVIQRTCETYPRNYHGWSHWHLMINICYASIHFSDDSATQRDFFGVIIHAYTSLQNWVNHHVSDYSAMHQLCQTQTLIEHLTLKTLLTNDLTSDVMSSALADHALLLVTAFPTHESLWMYLRVSLANLPQETRTNILEQIKNQNISEDSTHFAKQLFSWFAR